MTTKKGQKTPLTMTDTHLISDHDNHGDHVAWCCVEFAENYTESFAQTTCLDCLKTVIVYAVGAQERLRQLTEASRATDSPTKCEICERLVKAQPCNDYRWTDGCSTCGHEYLCHEESRTER